MRSQSRSESEDEGQLNSDDSESSTEGITSEEGEIQSDFDENGDADSAAEETPWERGQRLARERLRKAKLLRLTDVDLEEKKMKLVVLAPETNEDELTAIDSSASSFTDVLWTNYYKLAIVGCTQLTGKRSLPCDLELPSNSKIAYWRRHFGGGRHLVTTKHHRSDSDNSVSDSSDEESGRSRTSSLSSLAGSILLAVPDCLAADDDDASDRGRKRRGGRKRKSGRRGSNSSSSFSSHSSKRSNLRNQIASKSIAADKRNRHASSRSRSSSSSSSHYSRGERSQSPKRRNDGRKPYGSGPAGGNSWRGRRPMAYVDNQRGPNTAHYQGDSRGDTFDSGLTHRPSQALENRYGGGGGAGNKWNNSGQNRYVNRHTGPLMPNEKPVKRPWVADPSYKIQTPVQVPSRPIQTNLRSSSHSSTASSSHSKKPHTSQSPAKIESVAEKTTFITSYSSHSFSMQHIPRRSSPPRFSSRPGPARGGRDESPPPIIRQPLNSQRNPRHEHVPVDIGRQRDPSPVRRKSRSPFAELSFGNQPPSQTSRYSNINQQNSQPTDPQSGLQHTQASLPLSSMSYEQTVPLLAGSVNPVNPLDFASQQMGNQQSLNSGELPAASARPGVKLKIAPRVKAPVLTSGLTTRHLSKRPFPAASTDRQRSASSSASSVSNSHRSSRSASHTDVEDTGRNRRADDEDPMSSSKRMRQMGYIDVSPGGFDDGPYQSKEIAAGKPVRYGHASPRKNEPSSISYPDRAMPGTVRHRGGDAGRGYGGGGGVDEGRGGRCMERGRGGRNYTDRRQNRSGGNIKRDMDDASYSYRQSGNYRDRRQGGGFGNREEGNFYNDQPRLRNPRNQDDQRRVFDRGDRRQQQQQPSSFASNRPVAPRRRGSPYAGDSQPAPNNFRLRRNSPPTHSSYRGPRADRSRSPFESSRGGEDAVAAEKRMNELRQRLNVVDGAIAELRGSGVTTDN